MLTTDDISGELRVSKKTVYRMLRRGKIKAVRLGKLWRVREEDFEQFRRDLK